MPMYCKNMLFFLKNIYFFKKKIWVGDKIWLNVRNTMNTKGTKKPFKKNDLSQSDKSVEQRLNLRRS